MIHRCRNGALAGSRITKPACTKLSIRVGTIVRFVDEPMTTDTAVRLGILYTRTSESTFAAFDFFGEDTASAGWVTRFGSPARDNAAH
jgi:hypothetical protein